MDANDSVTGKLGASLDFDGTNDVVSAGDTGQTVKAISFWISPVDITSRDIVDLDGTSSIGISAGSDIVASNFTGETIFVNGAEASAIATQDVWYHVVVTTATGVSASDFKIGKASSFFQGEIDDVRIFSRELSAGDVDRLYRTRVTTAATLDDFPTNYPADDSTDELPDGTSYFHVRPLTGSGNWGAERSFTAAYRGGTPVVAKGSIYEEDGATVIAEGGTIVVADDGDAIQFKPVITNYEAASARITAFYDLNTDETALAATSSPTTEDADGSGNPACHDSVDYEDCVSKIWYDMTTSAGDYLNTPFSPTTEVDGLANGQYKARVTASNTTMSNPAIGYGGADGGDWWSFHHHNIGYGAYQYFNSENNNQGYLDGWAHSELTGWIKLRAGAPSLVDCASQPDQSETAFGVMVANNGTTLCGFAYSESFGWISFKGTQGGGYGVTLSGRKFSGYALSESLGWIKFDTSL